MKNRLMVFCLVGWMAFSLSVGLFGCTKGQTADRKSPPVAGTKADKDNIAREEDDQADEELKKEEINQKVKEAMNELFDKSDNKMTDEERDAINDMFDLFADRIGE